MDQVQLFLHANKHQLGYVMNEAIRIWNKDVTGGAFTVGECYGIVDKYGTYDALLKENARLREALGYYADNKNYQVNAVDQWGPEINIMMDSGSRASRALRGDTHDE